MTFINRIALSGLLAASALLAGCSQGGTWTDYIYKEQHFAAAFTAPPKVTEGAPFLVEENDGSVDFGVTAACNIVTDKTPDQILSDAVEGSRINGTVRNLTYTALGQTMGREMLVDRAGAPTIKQRIFVKDHCLYLVFATTKSGPDDDQAKHFLDSFRFL